MTRSRSLTTRRTGWLAVVACAATLAMSSCSAEDLAGEVAERSIENAGGGEADVDFDADTGEFKVETDEGSFSSGSELPADFPQDEIPLLDGTILQAAASSSDGAEGFVVLLEVDGEVEQVLDAAEQRLVDAGFEVDPEAAPMAGMGLRQVLDDAYTVTMQAVASEEATTLNYIVVTS